MSKTKSLQYQIKGQLLSQLRIGESKHAAKAAEGTHAPEGIFSWTTYNNYLKHALAFGEYIKTTYNLRSLENAKKFVPEYIAKRTEAGLSAWTLQLDINALAKLYKTPTAVFMAELGIRTTPRLRKDIKRSRTAPDKHYAEHRHQEIADFGKGTALRRHELRQVRAKDVYEVDGLLYVHVNQGKGGKPREVLVRPEYRDHVLKLSQAKNNPDQLLFAADQIPCRLPEHRYRAEYALAMYESIARPLETLQHKEKYFCRADKKGTVYDREAMLVVSRYLGHNRVDVIAYSYLQKPCAED